MSALDHVAISTADYPTSMAFYEKALAPLGVKTHMKFEGEEGNVAGLGSDEPFLWVGDGGKLAGGLASLVTLPLRLLPLWPKKKRLTDTYLRDAHVKDYRLPAGEPTRQES